MYWLVILLLLEFVSCNPDPYRTLGVGKGASHKQIRAAYKKLAREWHPDKNREEGAEERFIIINQAYEVLSDSSRRQQYDQFGTFDEPRAQRHHAGNDFFSGDFPRFRFERSSNAYDKNRISYRMYMNSVLPRSWHKPYLVMVYSDWCISCFQYEQMWERIMGDLEDVGVGVGSVNNMMEGYLVKELHVSRLPSVVAIVEGKAIVFSGTINHKEVIKFARRVLPVHLVMQVTDGNIRAFLDSWKFNKVPVLIVGPLEKARIRILTAAFETQPFTRFGYVQAGNADKEISKVLGLKNSVYESVLIFNERPENGPIASMTAKELSRDSLINLINNNKFLLLPRLSAQEYFDELCPISSGARGSRKLCAVLVVSDSEEDLVHVNALRNFVEERAEGRLDRSRIRLTYMFSNKQQQFLQALTNQVTVSNEIESRDVVVVWRTDEKKAKYSWFRGMWNIHENKQNESEEDMIMSLNMLLSGKTPLTHQAALNLLINEHGPGWFTRFAKKVVSLWETVTLHSNKDDILPVFSVLATFFFILVIGYGLNYANSLEMQDQAKRKQQQTKKEGKKVDSVSETWRIMRELRAETYFGMVRLLKPGCRTLVVLLDEASKDLILPKFTKIVAPLRHNKMLMFGYVNVDKNLGWFKMMLQHTLGAQITDSSPGEQTQGPISKLNAINPKQVVGTVLVLNGWRLYFHMYHPKHVPNKMKANGDKGFLGMNGNESDSSDSERSSDAEDGNRKGKNCRMGMKLDGDNVLDGLPNWLDRLSEGSITRYYISEWPAIK